MKKDAELCELHPFFDSENPPFVSVFGLIFMRDSVIIAKDDFSEEDYNVVARFNSCKCK